MIIWLLNKRKRRYFYLAIVIVLLDVFVGAWLINWELQIMKSMWG
jgi:hypothetical protein